jgi:antibiotic biosynthesis monooxygenase (ABM) superfamily enzyme
MIICLIEFETMPGREEEQQNWLSELLPIVHKVPGFRGKERWAHISGDGRVNTL